MAPKDAPEDAPAESETTNPEVELKPGGGVEDTRAPNSSSQQPTEPQTTDLLSIAGLSMTDIPVIRAPNPDMGNQILGSTALEVLDNIKVAINSLSNDDRNYQRLKFARDALNEKHTSVTKGGNMLALACAVSDITPSWVATSSAAPSSIHHFDPSPDPAPKSSEYISWMNGTNVRSQTLLGVLEGAKKLEGKDFDDFLDYLIHVLGKCRGLVGEWNVHVLEQEEAMLI